MANLPRFLNDEAFKCLRAGDREGFSRATANCQQVDLTGSDLRATDFRNMDLSKLILRDCYLRDAIF